MKKLSILFLSILIISCKEQSKPETQQASVIQDTIAKNEVSQAPQSSCSSWVESFREFRNAVYTNDRTKASKFVKFPILGSEIWFLVYQGEAPDTNGPFTELDFDKKFDKVFSKRFVSAILKIKSEDLYKDGEARTIEFKEGEDVTYSMMGAYDKTDCILRLSLLSNTVHRDDEGNVQDGGEFSIMYEFSVRDGEIKLVNIGLAG